MTVARALALAAAAGVLASCGRPSGTPITPAPSPICAMRTEGPAIKSASGDPVVLHGATLPSLREMEQSGQSSDEALRRLAENGAVIARLIVREHELGPTFVPGRVLPFVEAAQNMGLVVVLAWDNTGDDKPKNQMDAAEDWVRIALTYLRNRPGVWLDPFANEMNTDNTRKRIGAQRIVDVVRGLGADNMIFVADAGWLADADPEIGKPLTGGNVVYAVARADAASLGLTDRVPLFIIGGAGASGLEAVDGSIANIGADPRILAPVWRQSTPCR